MRKNVLNAEISDSILISFHRQCRTALEGFSCRSLCCYWELAGVVRYHFKDLLIGAWGPQWTVLIRVCAKLFSLVGILYANREKYMCDCLAHVMNAIPVFDDGIAWRLWWLRSCVFFLQLCKWLTSAHLQKLTLLDSVFGLYNFNYSLPYPLRRYW